MILRNVTVVILGRVANNGLVVKQIIENPSVPSNVDGSPVIGPLMRRLYSVKEVAHVTGLSKNKAAEERRNNPISYLGVFPGQLPLLQLAAA